MKKTFICIALLALLVSCNGSSKIVDIPISKTHCTYTMIDPYLDEDKRSTENLVIEHQGEGLLFLIYNYTNLIDIEDAKEYIDEYETTSYLFAEIKGIEIEVDSEDYDDDYQKLIYYLKIDVKNLDFDALSELENRLKTKLEVDVYESYALAEYIASIEEYGWECEK